MKRHITNNVTQTLIARWNGTQWTVVKSPSSGSFNTQLVSVAVVSANDVWAVGHADSVTLGDIFPPRVPDSNLTLRLISWQEKAGIILP